MLNAISGNINRLFFTGVRQGGIKLTWKKNQARITTNTLEKEHNESGWVGKLFLLYVKWHYKLLLEYKW